MPCIHPDVPKYLHYTDSRKIFEENAFKNSHLVFRTGFKERENPIDFPLTSTSISVSWSKLIEKNHVLNVVKACAKNPDKMGNHVYFGRISDLKVFNIEKVCTEGKYAGPHIITALIKHVPVECNYSHSEILIVHEFYENNELKSNIIEHKHWDKSVFKKSKGADKEFFTLLDLDFRHDMAYVLKNDVIQLQTSILSKIFSKKTVFRFMFFFNTILSPFRR